MRTRAGSPFLSKEKLALCAVLVGAGLPLRGAFAQKSSDTPPVLAVESSQFERAYDADPGTLRICLRNSGKSPLRISSVLLDDIALPPAIFPDYGHFTADRKDHSVSPISGASGEARVLWCKVEPDPIPANSVALLVLKLARPPTRPMKITSMSDQGASAETVVENSPSSIAIRRVVTDNGRVFVFLENLGISETEIDHVTLNGRRMTDLDAEPIKGRGGIGVVSATVPGDVLLSRRMVVQIVDRFGRAANAFSRPAAPFTVSYVQDALETDLQDPDQCETTGCGKLASLELLTVCPIHAFPTLQAAACEALRVHCAAKSKDPEVVTASWVCKTNQVRGLYLFAEIGDAVVTNPIQPRRFDEIAPANSTKKRIQDILQASQYTPWYAVISTARDFRYPEFTKTPPEPDELDCMAWMAIGGGAKGMYWRNTPQNEGQADRITAIGDRIAQMGAFLRVSYPVKTTSLTVESVNGYALLTGTKDIIIITTPITGAVALRPGSVELRVEVPPNQVVQSVEEFLGKGSRPVQFKCSEGSLCLTLDNVAQPRQFICRGVAR